jgi:hypothetical protein
MMSADRFEDMISQRCCSALCSCVSRTGSCCDSALWLWLQVSSTALFGFYPCTCVISRYHRSCVRFCSRIYSQFYFVNISHEYH